MPGMLFEDKETQNRIDDSGLLKSAGRTKRRVAEDVGIAERLLVLQVRPWKRRGSRGNPA
jgi:hypothetical protein